MRRTGRHWGGTQMGQHSEKIRDIILRAAATALIGAGAALLLVADVRAQTGPLVIAKQGFAAPERFKLGPQAHLHSQWPGDGKPGDAAFDQFYASQFPSLVDFPLQQALNRDATV